MNLTAKQNCSRVSLEEKRENATTNALVLGHILGRVFESGAAFVSRHAVIVVVAIIIVTDRPPPQAHMAARPDADKCPCFATVGSPWGSPVETIILIRLPANE